MTLNELIEKSLKLKEEYGDLPVFVYADHGQWAEEATDQYICLIQDTDIIADEDKDDYPDAIKAIVIE